jgi:hypothetical protein
MPPFIGAKSIPVASLAEAVERGVVIVDGWEMAHAKSSQDGGRQLLELCGQEHMLRESP